MMDINQFRMKLIKAIDNNEIVLPTLPEVALQVRDEAEKEDTTARKLAEIITTDAAISARLLQVANSPLYRPRAPIEDVQMAVTRLGNKLVKSLVTSLAMKQIYQATNDFMEHKLRKVWEDSVNVAAVSKVLAQSLPQLSNEQAMLAGLIHNIGILPILTMAESFSDLSSNERMLEELIDALYPEIGAVILKNWDFPEAVTNVPAEHRNHSREGIEADFADVVMVARLQLGLDNLPVEQWADISAFDRVGLDAEINITDVEDTAEDIESVKQAIA
ncbi:MAG: HDOD domain-containing protein [Gammaproteobacteria bacterium]|nr:HDOD domain-containing protein [Gammaproteobacteria bacterium]